MTYQEIRLEFEHYIEKEIFDTSSYPLYYAINYIMASGAKRFRPTLLMMSYHIFRDDIKRTLPAAFAIELFHNFTLIHDDIMDNAFIRRGKPAVHEKFGLNQAILSGDAMMMIAYQYLMRSSSKENIASVMETMTKMAIEVCEGQDLDMVFEKKNVVEVSEYLKMIELKTSVLLAASLKIGGLLAGAKDTDVHHLYEFGRNIGIAFQIQDDILDTFGNSQNVGKRIGGDIYQKKKTYLFTKALEILSPEIRNHLLSYYTSDKELIENDVSEVKSIFKNNLVLEEARIEQERYYGIAMDHLSAIEASEDRKSPLKKVSRMLFERKF
jgi:geranylgeranyl diphosphate synthase type II